MNTTFGIGNVLATGFRVWFKNVAPFMLITALIYSPLWIWAVSLVHGEMTVDRLQAIAVPLGIAFFLTWLMNILVSAALTYGVVMELQGQRASIGACIATGLGRFFPVLGVGLLSALCIFGGFVALIVPGIIMFCMLYVATQAAVLERPGLLGALRRSRELTRGHRFEIFGLLIILGVLSWGLEKVVETLVIPHASDPDYLDETLGRLSLNVYVSFVEQMVLGSLSAVMASVAYYFLRAEKEGTSASELAAIFD